MGFDPADQDIVTLLAELKRTGGEYPEQMLAARRQSYLNKMAEVGLGIGIGAGLREAAKVKSASPTAAASSKVLETVLLFAIAVETGTVAYLYRDKLSEFFQSILSEPMVQQVTPAPAIPTSLEIQGIAPSAAVASTVPSETLPVSATETASTPIETPIPSLAENTSAPAANQTNATPDSQGTPIPGIAENTSAPAASQPDSTPNPGGNSGNHYGQTPIPERTKDSNNKPPTEGGSDPSPKDESKPTKAK